MFWKLSALSASSPVDAVLDKEDFTLDELLDEEEIIQECKALNSRLINFLRDKTQVEQLLRYVIEEPPEDADSRRTFKFPFVACEVFTCEIDVILRTLVEEEELMDLLFSYLDPNRHHSPLLAGYFSKVVVCLMLRKTVLLMNYVHAHQDVFRQLVDLIGITSIMEVLVRLVGADDHVYPSYLDVMQWLSDSNLLEMIVDKLSLSSSPEVQANAAETLCAITRNAGSPLATKLSSPSFVSRILGHALEGSHSKSGLVHSLSVCISLLDPRRSLSSFIHSVRGQLMYEAPIKVNLDTVDAMLPKLGDLLMLLSVSADEKVLPMPYGELRPPLGKHRLKIVEFIAVLLKAGNATTEEELVKSGTIKRVIDLFFEYPYNNALHHHVETIISSCMESKNDNIVDHLFNECDLIGKILQADKHPILSGDLSLPTAPASGKALPRAGNIGHITRISNKILQVGQSHRLIQTYMQENAEWNNWEATVLQERNVIWNVYRWGCGRPTPLHARDSDDDIFHDRDYDVTALANNLSQAFSSDLYVREGSEEGNGPVERDDEDVYFDDDSAEVVISSLRLGDDQGSLFTNSNWFTFRDERTDNAAMSTTLSGMMDEINLNENANCGGNSSSDDEVVVGEDEDLVEADERTDGPSGSDQTPNKAEPSSEIDKMNIDEAGPICFQQTGSDGAFGENAPADWARFEEPLDSEAGRSGMNSRVASSSTDMVQPPPSCSSSSGTSSILANGNSTRQEGNEASPLRADADANKIVTASPSLFEEDVEFVGVEPEGTEKAMEQALREGIVGEAGALKRNPAARPANAVAEENAADDSAAGMKEFNDANYWRVEQEVAVLE